MKPPKCRQCGKEEWRHLCMGAPSIHLRKDAQRLALPKRKAKRPAKRAKAVAGIKVAKA